MLEKQLTNICTQQQHLPLWCIDATETTEAPIAQTLCELLYTATDPDADYPEVNNIAHIAWITDKPLDPPMTAFPPGQDNLLEAIASSLQEMGT